MKTKEELFPLKVAASEILSVTKSQAMMKAYDEIMATKPEEVVSYGYNWIDEKLVGIMPGQIILIGGETGTGKSSFANNIIYHNAENGIKGAMFSLEETPADYEKKCIYFEIGRLRWQEGKQNYPWRRYITGELNNNQEFQLSFAKAYERIKNDNIVYQDVGENKVDIDLVSERIKMLKKQGFNLFLIDHIHYFDLTTAKDSKDRLDTKASYIEKILVSLHLLVKSLGIKIILIAHYKKLDGKKPGIDSYKDSIAFSQIAYTVINLWRDRGNDTTEAERRRTYFYIPKTRHLGGEGCLVGAFNPITGQYEEEHNQEASFL